MIRNRGKVKMNRLTRRDKNGTADTAEHVEVMFMDEKSQSEILGIIERLASYEDLGLKPEQIRKVNRLYSEKCRDVVELQKSPWIPVTERLPKCEEEVYIQTKNGTMTTAVYEYGTMPNEKSIWNWNDIDFDYDEETDTYLVSKGWWEYRHYNLDDVYNNKVDEEVIAWMPLPEPYAESVKK